MGDRFEVAADLVRAYGIRGAVVRHVSGAADLPGDPAGLNPSGDVAAAAEVGARAGFLGVWR